MSLPELDQSIKNQKLRIKGMQRAQPLVSLNVSGQSPTTQSIVHCRQSGWLHQWSRNTSFWHSECASVLRVGLWWTRTRLQSKSFLPRMPSRTVLKFPSLRKEARPWWMEGLSRPGLVLFCSQAAHVTCLVVPNASVYPESLSESLLQESRSEAKSIDSIVWRNQVELYAQTALKF